MHAYIHTLRYESLYAQAHACMMRGQKQTCTHTHTLSHTQIVRDVSERSKRNYWNTCMHTHMPTHVCAHACIPTRSFGGRLNSCAREYFHSDIRMCVLHWRVEIHMHTPRMFPETPPSNEPKVNKNNGEPFRKVRVCVCLYRTQARARKHLLFAKVYRSCASYMNTDDAKK
jgi:hypothetical protein